MFEGEEIARIGVLPCGMQIHIVTDDGYEVPHFHVRDIGTNTDVCCISLTEPKYTNHLPGLRNLLDSEANELADFMEQPAANIRWSDNFEKTVDMWNANNIQQTPDILCPNYRRL